MNIKIIGEVGFINFKQLSKNKSWYMENGWILKDCFNEFFQGNVEFSIITHFEENGEIFKEILKHNRINKDWSKKVLTRCMRDRVLFREAWGYSSISDIEKKLLNTNHEKLEVKTEGLFDKTLLVLE